LMPSPKSDVEVDSPPPNMGESARQSPNDLSRSTSHLDRSRSPCRSRALGGLALGRLVTCRSRALGGLALGRLVTCRSRALGGLALGRLVTCRRRLVLHVAPQPAHEDDVIIDDHRHEGAVDVDPDRRPPPHRSHRKRTCHVQLMPRQPAYSPSATIDMKSEAAVPIWRKREASSKLTR